MRTAQRLPTRRTLAALVPFVVALLNVAPAAADESAAHADPGRRAIGLNLAAVVDWGTAWPFVDVFKHARPWIAQRVEGGPWNTGQPIETTPDGWPLLEPGQAAATLMLREISPRYPAGRYVCTYEGDGDIEFGFAARAIHAEPGRVELDVTHDNEGIYLKIVRSNRDDPIRNIRVWMPGFENARSPFHPLWLERLRPFRVLRFMDWQRTNEDWSGRWSDRTTPSSAMQSTSRGVALEYMIKVSNELEADPWFCMPHRADDAYVRRFAEMVRRDLHPGATIYVEYSNEAWNSLFPVYEFLAERARQRGIDHPEATADEARRVFEIWLDVFEGDERRIVRVAAGQHHNPWIARTLCERLDGEFDAVSIAAYFGYDDADAETFTAATTEADMMDAVRRRLERDAIPLIETHAALAREWSRRTGREIPLIAYEGGQHLTAWGDTSLPYYDVLLGVQDHPAMIACYERLFEAWEDAGGGLFCAFSSIGRPGRWGSFGHLEYQDQSLDTAPKFRTLLETARRWALRPAP